MDLGTEYGDRARRMSRAEWKAARAKVRESWSEEARRAYDLARRNTHRFGFFLVGMVLIAGVLGALR